MAKCNIEHDITDGKVSPIDLTNTQGPGGISFLEKSALVTNDFVASIYGTNRFNGQIMETAREYTINQATVNFVANELNDQLEAADDGVQHYEYLQKFAERFEEAATRRVSEEGGAGLELANIILGGLKKEVERMANDIFGRKDQDGVRNPEDINQNKSSESLARAKKLAGQLSYGQKNIMQLMYTLAPNTMKDIVKALDKGDVSLFDRLFGAPSKINLRPAHKRKVIIRHMSNYGLKTWERALNVLTNFASGLRLMPYFLPFGVVIGGAGFAYATMSFLSATSTVIKFRNFSSRVYANPFGYHGIKDLSETLFKDVLKQPENLFTGSISSLMEIFPEKMQAFAKRFPAQIFNGTSLVETMLFPQLKRYAIGEALIQMGAAAFNENLSEEENIRLFKKKYKEDPAFGSAFLQEVQRVLGEMSGLGANTRANSTNSQFAFSNLLGNYNQNIMSRFFRKIFGRFHERIALRELEKGNPGHAEFARMTSAQDADFLSVVGGLIDGVLLAHHLVSIIQSMGDPDEDDEKRWDQLKTKSGSNKYFASLEGTHLQIGAFMQSPKGRAMAYTIEAALHIAGFAPEDDSDVANAMEDHFGIGKRTLGALSPGIQIINDMLRGLSDPINTVGPIIVSMLDGDESTTLKKGFQKSLLALGRMEERFPDFFSEDMKAYQDYGYAPRLSYMGLANMIIGDNLAGTKKRLFDDKFLLSVLKSNVDGTPSVDFFNDEDNGTYDKILGILKLGVSQLRTTKQIKALGYEEAHPMTELTTSFGETDYAVDIIMREDWSNSNLQDAKFAFTQVTKALSFFQGGMYSQIKDKGFAYDSDGVRVTNQYNKAEIELMEANAKEILGDEFYKDFNSSIDSIVAIGDGDEIDVALKKYSLEVLKHMQVIKENNPDDYATSHSFLLAYMAEKMYNKFQEEYSWDDRKLDQVKDQNKARVGRIVGPMVNDVNEDWANNIHRKIIRDNVPGAKKYFTDSMSVSDDGTQYFNFKKDVLLQNGGGAQAAAFDMYLIGLRKIAEGDSDGANMIAPLNQWYSKYEAEVFPVLDENGETIISEPSEKGKEILNVVLASYISTHLEASREEGMSDDEVANSILPMLIGNEEKIQAFIDNDNIDQEFKNIFMSKIYHEKFTIDDLDRMVGDDELLNNSYKEFYGKAPKYGYYNDKKKNGWREYTPYSGGYRNSLSRNYAKTTYPRLIQYIPRFGEFIKRNYSSYSYNNYGKYANRSYMNKPSYTNSRLGGMRSYARYNNVKTGYPVFDKQRGSGGFFTKSYKSKSQIDKILGRRTVTRKSLKELLKSFFQG